MHGIQCLNTKGKCRVHGKGYRLRMNENKWNQSKYTYKKNVLRKSI